MDILRNSEVRDELIIYLTVQIEVNLYKRKRVEQRTKNWTGWVMIDTVSYTHLCNPKSVFVTQ